uniref:Uncharacterized protein n=1 Tax=Aegilops tauschii subsp. strangulata TaxID=200361 RepID=A0A453EPN2_AEGTS
MTQTYPDSQIFGWLGMPLPARVCVIAHCSHSYDVRLYTAGVKITCKLMDRAKRCNLLLHDCSL